jgi:hypothetical protein
MTLDELREWISISAERLVRENTRIDDIDAAWVTREIAGGETLPYVVTNGIAKAVRHRVRALREAEAHRATDRSEP